VDSEGIKSDVESEVIKPDVVPIILRGGFVLPIYRSKPKAIE